MLDYFYAFRRHNKRMDPNGINVKLGRFALNENNIFSMTTTEFPNGDDPGEFTKFSRPLLTFAAVMTILIMIVGIFGNALTVVALLKCPKVRNVAAAFIISLCVADCLFCVLVLPFNALRFIQGTWTHGDFLCRLVPFIQYGNVGVSLLCIAMITINRYIMIAHHSSYARIYKQHWIATMILFCWLFAYGMQLPTFFKVWGAFGYDSNLGTCSILKDSNGRSSKTALFVIAFVIPCIIIIGCYARIFWVVHESEQRMRQHASKQNSIPNNLRVMQAQIGTKDTNNRKMGQNVVPSASMASVSDSNISIAAASGGASDSAVGTSSAVVSPDAVAVTTADPPTVVTSNTMPSGKFAQLKSIRVKDTRDAKAKRNEWRITKMVLAIFLSFVCCYLPITVTKVADKDVQYPAFHIFGYIMLYLSSCINPIIYVIMNKQYRQAYKTVILCQPARLLAFTHGGSSVGEKLKDIGYSYNHSRTMVSQVSIAEDSSYPSQQQYRRDSPHPKRLPDIRGSIDSNDL